MTLFGRLFGRLESGGKGGRCGQCQCADEQREDAGGAGEVGRGKTHSGKMSFCDRAQVKRKADGWRGRNRTSGLLLPSAFLRWGARRSPEHSGLGLG